MVARTLAPVALALTLLGSLPVQARPGWGAGGVGGPASGAGVRPGAGWGAPGVGAGGLGGPASGAGVRPGAGWGAPGVGLTRAPGAAYGAAVYHPAWAASGSYWAARPWPHGWYGVSAPVWWGAAALASTAAVATAVNAAAAQQTPWIVVPQTTLQLNYASVVAAGTNAVRFTYLLNGISQNAMGDCVNGLLNGQPVAGDTAALLNAACTVAFGNPG